MQTIKNKAFRVSIHMLVFNGNALVRKSHFFEKGAVSLN